MWSVIAKRMKHGHRSRSRQGGKPGKDFGEKMQQKAVRSNRTLEKTCEEEKVEELYGEILMSAKVSKKDGKGYQYPAIGHVVGLDGKIQGERKRLLNMAWY